MPTSRPWFFSLLVLVLSLAACTHQREEPSSTPAFTGASTEACFYETAGSRQNEAPLLLELIEPQNQASETEPILRESSADVLGAPLESPRLTSGFHDQRDHDVEGVDDTRSEDASSRTPNLEPLLIKSLSGPPSHTSETVSTFDFECSKSDCRFTCVLTGAALGVVASKAPCEPGVTYSSLEDDAYTFTVVASDIEGNMSEPSSWGWTVDTILPSIEITAAPPEETSERWALLEFECTNRTCLFECALDHQDGTGALRRGSFESCGSPHMIGDLEPGQHVLRLRATDTIRREAFAEHEWSVLPSSPGILSVSHLATIPKTDRSWTSEGSGIALSDQRGHLAVWDGQSMDLLVYDLHAEATVGVFALTDDSSMIGKGLDYSPDGSFLYGLEARGKSLVKVDTSDYSVIKTVDPLAPSGSDLRVISDDRLLIAAGDYLVLYDHDLNEIDYLFTPYAGFISFDEEESKLYVSGLGYMATSGRAVISLDDDALTLEWQQGSSSGVSGILPLNETYLEVFLDGAIDIRRKSDNALVASHRVLERARMTPAAQLSRDSVVLVDDFTGDIFEYRESTESLERLAATDSPISWHSATNGVEITPGFLAIAWNDYFVELWSVASSR